MPAIWHHRNKSFKYLVEIKSYWTSCYQNITANKSEEVFDHFIVVRVKTASGLLESYQSFLMLNNCVRVALVRYFCPINNAR